MSKYTCKTFGRGQALQKVMDHSINNRNVCEMRMDNYTNEKIMEFVETLSQRNSVGPSAQNLPSSNCTFRMEDEELEEPYRSFGSERQWENTESSSSMKVKNKCKDHSTTVPKNNPPKIVTGQFIFKEEDFPPL